MRKRKRKRKKIGRKRKLHNLLRHLIYESLLLEDRRGNIVKRLGLPRGFADFLHEFHPPQSHKYSYWMAEQFLNAYDGEAKRWLFSEREKRKGPLMVDGRRAKRYRDLQLYPTNPSTSPNTQVQQGDEVLSTPVPFDQERSTERPGKFVGITPGGTLWISWPGNKTEEQQQQEYERMVVRLEESWEKHFVQGLTRKWDLGGFEDTFKKIFEWHAATGGGADLTKFDQNKAMELVNAHKAFRESEGEGKIIMTFDDGYYWIDLAKTHCPYEEKEMGHCAEDERGTLWSLRDKHGKPHVTATVTGGGDIVQMKGKENKKPVEKYHKYIAQLLAGEHIRAIKTGSDTADFEITDLGEKPMKWLVSKRPAWKYLTDPRQAVLDYASGELTWEQFQPAAKHIEGGQKHPPTDKFHKDYVEWATNIEDMSVLFVNDEDHAVAEKEHGKRKKSDVYKRVELIQNFLVMIWRQDFGELGSLLRGGKKSYGGSSDRDKERLRPLVLAANDFLIKTIKKKLDLEGLHYARLAHGQLYLAGKMPYPELAKMIAGTVYEGEPKDRYDKEKRTTLSRGISSVVYDYININDLRINLQKKHILKIFEPFGYWVIQDLEVEWHPGHTIAVDADVEHNITGQTKSVSEYIGTPEDVEFTDVRHDGAYGDRSGGRKYITPKRGRSKAETQQSVVLTGTDEEGRDWDLQIELDPKTGEWDDETFYDWDCSECWDEESEKYEIE